MVRGIQSRLLLLPAELKHRIVELSSYDSLASLARTHTAFQREAEQALYRTLSNPSLNCLETLATNSEKAGFVHFLTMECYDHIIEDHWLAPIDYLLNALVNMHSLSDFRLRLPRFYNIKPWMDNLDKILCNDDHHFQLQTLYCDETLDLSRIIRSQTKLQIFGVYNYYGFEFFGFLETLTQLQNSQLHFPVVVLVEYDLNQILHEISVFPALYSIDRHPTIHQILTEFFGGDQGSSYSLATGTDEIPGLSIYLVDSLDMPSIHVLTNNMTMTFPNVTHLTFNFQNPCEIPPQETKKIISLFPDLVELDFGLYLPMRMGGGRIPDDIKMDYVKYWELACPRLRYVSFMDPSTLNKEYGEWILY